MQTPAPRFPHGRQWMIITLAALLFVPVACQEDEVCEEVTANDLRIGFYPFDNDEWWATIDSLLVFTLEKPDTPVHDTLYQVSILELPLNTNADSCSFIIDFFETRDTLWLEYQRETHLISVECGFTMFFTLTNIEFTENYIEGLVIEEPYVTNSLDEHITIFVPDTLPGDL